nr:meiotically up-regulated gene 190 protein [Quercus suber]
MSGQDDANESRRIYKAPYTPHRTIPTIKKYEQEKADRKAQAGEGQDGADLTPSRTQQYKDSWRDYWNGTDRQDNGRDQQSSNTPAGTQGTTEDEEDKYDTDDYEDEQPAMVDTSETAPDSQDPKQKRKGMKKKRKHDGEAERQVTDPVTHLPVTIRDYTTAALEEVPENDPPFGSTHRSATGLSNKSKPNQQLQKEYHEMEGHLQTDESLFPPPSFAAVRKEITDINKLGVTVGLVGTALIVAVAFGLEKLFRRVNLEHLAADKGRTQWVFIFAIWGVLGALAVGGIWSLIVGVRDWMTNRMNDVWEEQVWEADRKVRRGPAKRHETETVAWLNSLLSSVWPLINPDLFTSLADSKSSIWHECLPRREQQH